MRERISVYCYMLRTDGQHSSLLANGRQVRYVWRQLSFLSSSRHVLLLCLGWGGGCFGCFLLLTLLLFLTSLLLTLAGTGSEGVAVGTGYTTTLFSLQRVLLLGPWLRARPLCGLEALPAGRSPCGKDCHPALAVT